MSLAGVVLMYGMTVFSTNEPKPKSGMCVIQDCKNIFNDNKKKKAVLFLIIIIIIISFGAVFCLPILKSEVIFCISAMRSVPRFLTFSKSSFMEKERSIR